MNNTRWTDYDFKPAPHLAWRALHLYGDQPLVLYVAGWMVQVQDALDVDGTPYPAEEPFDNRPRRVVPVQMDSLGALRNVTEPKISFWKVLGPGDPEPTEAEVREANEEAAKRRKRRKSS